MKNEPESGPLGAATGFGLLSTQLVVTSWLGGYSFGTAALSPAGAFEYGAIYLAVFALTALCEEGGLRGYGFVQLSRARFHSGRRTDDSKV